jgi:hypothetical protein
MIPEFLIAFAAAPFVFYGSIIAIIIGLFVAAAYESIGGAGVCVLFALGIGVIAAGSIPAAISLVTANWLLITICAIACFPLSILWARFKWSLYTTEKVGEIKDKIEAIGEDRASQFYSTWNHTKEEILKTDFCCLSPKVKDNKQRIITWIILFIPDAIWFFIHDPITRFAEWTYTNIREWFQSASDKKFEKAFKKENVTDSLEFGNYEERR